VAWRVLVYTGMDRGEALSLRRRDVGLDAGRVAVRGSVALDLVRDAALVLGTLDGGHRHF
jgi:integrase